VLRLLQQQTVTVDGVPDHVRLVQLPQKAVKTGPHGYESRLLPDTEDEIVPNTAAIPLSAQLVHMIPYDLL
jgi:hypothetical protein